MLMSKKCKKRISFTTAKINEKNIKDNSIFELKIN